MSSFILLLNSYLSLFFVDLLALKLHCLCVILCYNFLVFDIISEYVLETTNKIEGMSCDEERSKMEKGKVIGKKEF